MPLPKPVIPWLWDECGFLRLIFTPGQLPYAQPTNTLVTTLFDHTLNLSTVGTFGGWTSLVPC